MIDVLALALARREALEIEAARLESFIRVAEELISGAAATDEPHAPRSAAEQPALPALVVARAAPEVARTESGPDSGPALAPAVEPVQEAAEDEPHLVLRRVLQEAAEAVPSGSQSRLARLRRG